MGNYGKNETLAEGATSANAYVYVYIVNTGFKSLKITVHNDHVANGITYIIEAQMRSVTGEWIPEVAATALAADSLDEIDIDAGFARYRIGYKSTVAATHSDDVTIEYSGRIG